MKRFGGILCSILVVCLVLSGCGGGSSHKNSQNSGSTKMLTSITVTSTGATSVAAGTTLQLAAHGNYSDGTVADITSTTTWTTSNVTMATANTAGLITTLKQGAVTVTATQGKVAGTLIIQINQADLSTISVTGGSSLSAGSSEQLNAIGTYTDGRTLAMTSQVTWQSSDASVASVSGSGMLQGIKSGTVTVTATMGTISGTLSVTVDGSGTHTLTAINIGVPSPSLASGSTEQLTATGVFSDAGTQDVTSQVVWQSSDATIASVNSGGGLTGLKGGTVTVTATMNSVSGTASVTINAPTLSSISITPASTTIASGQTKQLTAKGVYSDGTSQDVSGQVAWSSGTTSAATISSSGLVSGVSAGTSTITASMGGKQATALITVTAAQLNQILVTPATASIATGQTQNFQANGIFSDGSTTDMTNSVTWTSSAANIATVDQTGLAGGVSAGSATITATSGSVSGSATLTVTTAVLTEVDISPDDQTIPIGGQLQLSVTGTFSDNTTQTLGNASWSTSDSTLATVDPNTGVVTGVANSNDNPVTITVTYGGFTDTTTVYVTDAVAESIQLTPATASIASGTTQQYSVNVVYSDGSIQPVTEGVSYLSSAPTVAGIDANGIATGLTAGQATITVAYKSLSATATLTVTQAVLTDLVVTPVSTLVGVNGNAQFTATGIFSDNSTQDVTSQVLWTSSNAAYATISAAGLATGVSTGAVQITATSGTISSSATLNVTTATLVSISITPSNPIVPPHSRIQLTAIGTFSDGSQLTLSGVRWRTNSSRYATVSRSGVLRTRRWTSSKAVTVYASLNGITGSTNVLVTSMTIQMLSIQPATPTITNGTQQDLSLIGTFSDGVTQVDLSASARWQTSNHRVAFVNRQGLVTGVSAGSVTITASIRGQGSATTTLTVSDATIQSITITPANSTVPLGGLQQFAASGLFSDGSTQDITSVCRWTSSTPTVAVINQKGIAYSATHGQTNINATFNSVTGSTPLNVN